MSEIIKINLRMVFLNRDIAVAKIVVTPIKINYIVKACRYRLIKNKIRLTYDIF